MAIEYRPSKFSISKKGNKSATRYSVIDTETGQVIGDISARAKRNITEAQAKGFANLSEKQRVQSGRVKPERLKSIKKDVTVYRFQSIRAAVEYAIHLNGKKRVKIVIDVTRFSEEYEARAGRRSGWFTFLNVTRVTLLRAMYKMGQIDIDIQEALLAFQEDGLVEAVNLWVFR